MESFNLSERLLNHPDSSGDGRYGLADEAVWQQVREPLLHSHGLRWSQLVLPNNYFFFARNDPERMHPLGLSHVLHDRYELVVCYRGKAKICIDEEVFEFSAGMIKLLRPGQFHMHFDFEGDNFAWLLFSFELDSGSTLIGEGNIICKLEATQADYVSRAVQDYVKQSRTSEEVFAIAYDMAVVVGSLKHAPRLAPIGRTCDGPYRSCEMLRRIALYANERMEEAVRINDLAREIGMSEGHLRKIFRELTGVSLGVWLRDARFGRGAKLIANSDLSISEIARLSGFETIYSFSQAFSKRVGISPTDYRKSLSDTNFSADANKLMIPGWHNLSAVPVAPDKQETK